MCQNRTYLRLSASLDEMNAIFPNLGMDFLLESPYIHSRTSPEAVSVPRIASYTL